MYYVHEIQTDSTGASSMITTSFANPEVANQKYYTILAAASVSNVRKHSAVLMDDEGETLKRETVFHRGATA